MFEYCEKTVRVSKPRMMLSGYFFDIDNLSVTQLSFLFVGTVRCKVRHGKNVKYFIAVCEV